MCICFKTLQEQFILLARALHSLNNENMITCLVMLPGGFPFHQLNGNLLSDRKSLSMKLQYSQSVMVKDAMSLS